MGQGKVAKSYGLQMANLPILFSLVLEQGRCESCLVVLEAAKVKVRGLRHTDGMSHGRSRRALESASGIVRTRDRALATEDSH
jgi:hypothetical protein